MIVLGLFLLAYVGFLVFAIVLSFSKAELPRRRKARFACLALAILPVVAIGAIVTWWRIMIGPSPPSIEALQHSFPSQRADLEIILRMSNEEPAFRRIDPKWLDQEAVSGKPAGRFMAGDPQIALPKPRWDQYRALYKRNGIRLGIQRDATRDAFIIVQSEGLLDRGHMSGYVFCNTSADAGDNPSGRYEPCKSTRDSDTHVYDGSGDEGYSFHKLADHWYAYDQGPG